MKKKSDKGVRETSNSVHKPILKVPCALKKHLKITFALTIKGRCGAARAAKTLRFEKYSGRHGDDLYKHIVQFVKYIFNFAKNSLYHRHGFHFDFIEVFLCSDG